MARPSTGLPTALPSRQPRPTASSRLCGCQTHPASSWASNGTPNGVGRTILSAWPSSGPSVTRAAHGARNMVLGRGRGAPHNMDLQLTGKTALITGGSKGIGRAAAQVLSDEGCNLILVARTRDTLEAAAAEIRASRQVNVRVIAADLSSDAAVKRVAEEAGEIDVLVNNAGAIPPGDIAAVNDETWRRAWDL